MQLFKSKDKFLQFTLNLESSKKFSLKQGITTTNENTLEALKRFSMLERQSFKTFYLWGEKGSGKNILASIMANGKREEALFILIVKWKANSSQKKIIGFCMLII